MGNDIKRSEEAMLTNYEACDSNTCLLKELSFIHITSRLSQEQIQMVTMFVVILSLFFLVKIERTNLKVWPIK